MKKNTYTAIITARGGSKGLPRKNVLPLVGKPMIAYTIISALESNIFERVVVTTDCQEIKSVSKTWGAEVIERPAHLSLDTSSSIDAIEHAIIELKNKEWFSTEFVLLQPTSPLRNKEHLIDSVKLYEEGKAKTLCSITEVVESPFKTIYKNNNGDFSAIREWEDLTKARQVLPKAYKTNGAIYIANIEKFLSSRNLIDKDSLFYEMSHQVSIDVDDMNDFRLVERVMSQ